MKHPLRASFYTLGCRLNQSETALIRDDFACKGYHIVDFGASCEVVVVNTCTVTQQAEAKCRQLVRQVLRQSPDAVVAVVGCYSQTGAEALAGIQGVDYVIGTQQKMQIAEIIGEPQKRPKPLVVKTKIERGEFTIPFVGSYPSATRANLKIQDGCNHMCTFCAVPFARGRARSRMFQDIEREAVGLVARGHCEVVLTGVNLGTYASRGKDLMDVIRMLETLDGLVRIRISSIEPQTIPDELVDHMAASDRLCPHLHIPLQSGDDAVLEAMQRGHTRAAYIQLIEQALSRVPNLCLGTDLMVGFPGEDDAAFEATRSLLEDYPFAYAHVFSYSDRAGVHPTRASGMEGKVDPGIKQTRSAILRELVNEKKQAWADKHLGRIVKVLMENEAADGIFQGFTNNYLKVRAPSKEDLANVFTEVLIEKTEGSTVIGSIQ